MGELLFVGLGLYDEKDMSVKAMEEAKECDSVFVEFYTSILAGTSVEKLEAFLGKPITVLSRKEVEEGDTLIKKAERERVAFLVPGDPMTATTHLELRLRAMAKGIRTRIIHGQSIITAAAGLTGLQAYKFGRVTTIPFPEEGYRPTSPYDVIKSNLEMGLHTLILLDIREGGECMTANEGISYLLSIEEEKGDNVFTDGTPVCVIGQAGSEEPVVAFGKAGTLVEGEFGPPPHTLVVPGQLHFMEEEFLATLG